LNNVNFKPTIVDKVVSYFAPVKGLQRMRARASMGALGSYVGASGSHRSLKNWHASGGSADKDDLPNLKTLRTRSRDLYRNDPLVAGVIDTNAASIVGSGLRVQAQIDRDYLGLSDDAAAEWEAAAEREFRFVAESVNCDAARSKNFYELQTTALISALLSGDLFATMPAIRRKHWPYTTTLSLIEADRVCNKDDAMDTDELAGGIRVDRYGAPIEYHVLKLHPGGYDMNREWVVIPAYGKSGRRNVIHLYRQTRPGQRRGVPYLAPVINHLKILSEYTEAELTAALISGLFTVFLKNESDEGDMAESFDENIELGPGAIVSLTKDESIETADPKRPNTAYDPFVTTIFRQIGAGLGIPYEILLKHFTSSYTASRAAFLEAWRIFKTRRRWIGDGFCQPFYEAVITEAVLSGRLQAPGFLDDPFVRKAYLGSVWTGPAAGQINEKVETSAAAARVKEGFSTRAREAAEINGSDYEQNVRKAKRETILLKESGLKEME